MNRINSFFRDTTKKTPEVTVAAVNETIPEITGAPKLRHWKPRTLRRPFLLSVTCITLGLLALVQALVIIDQRNDGLIFAPRISESGTLKTFVHQYLPTTIAVLYGLLWSWIDLDVRRIEPYRQLSKPGGATGRNSLLLHYPYDFLGFVPFTSFKRRHWPVFVSSCALILVAWGVTPLQGAIFATDTVTKSGTEPMQLSNHHLSIEDQATEVTANYTYSASNIVWLGERLPAFMTRETAFSAFRLDSHEPHQTKETWTARTTSFGLDLSCESPVLNRTDDRLESSHGCRVPLAFGPDGTDIVGDPDQQNEIKEFSAFFAGNQNHDGLSDYYLSPYCPDDVTNVFMIAFAKSRQSDTAPPGPVTRLFCQASYFEQAATTTVNRADGNVLDATDLGPQTPLRPGLFNTSLFEWQVNSAAQQNTVRGVIPSSDWPNQDAQLEQLALTMSISQVKSSKVIGLAIGAYERPLEDYLDPQVLAAMFQAYHRLLFARAMADVLSIDFEGADMIAGMRTYQTEAIRVVPGFAYAVEALLGLVAILGCILLVMTWNNSLILQTDPGSVTALMELVSGQETLLDQFSQHDQSTSHLLKAETRHSIYALTSSLASKTSALRLVANPHGSFEVKKAPSGNENPPAGYPAELSRKAGGCLVLALASVIAAIAYLYHTDQGHGLPLPSQNRFVRQMLQNYVPTIIATIIEPVWVLLNRIMCTMQPFEGLRSGIARTQRSIGLNYSSLPPQLVVGKALRAQHFILAAVCILALLANVLAIALSGMFNEEAVALSRPKYATPSFEPRFRSDFENMTDTGPNTFYSAMANFTSATPMPAWTDDRRFYLPMSLPADMNETDHFQVETTSMEIDPDCHPHAGIWNYTFSERSRNMTLTVRGRSGPLYCQVRRIIVTSYAHPMPCSDERIALEVFMPMTAHNETNSEERDECQQLIVGVWARTSAGHLCTDGGIATLTRDDATVMVCKPRIVSGSANVTVTGDSLVTQADAPGNHNSSESTLSPSTDPESAQVLRESTRSLFGQKVNDMITTQTYGGTWHNDSFPSDWTSYVMNNLDPDAGLLDPNSPPPDVDTAIALFTKAYRKVSAIWLSLNHEKLLVPTDARTTAVIGTVVQDEIRIMVSESMVILSITILALYILVAFAVYARQPARFLPRMPTTIASDMALFAASKAVEEMGRTTGADRDVWLDSARMRFGYGPYVGTDGKPHVGIERSPFVNSL
ncbi:hypothetical protein Q7P37_000673 [Cladosporium fusiforme]